MSRQQSEKGWRHEHARKTVNMNNKIAFMHTLQDISYEKQTNKDSRFEPYNSTLNHGWWYVPLIPTLERQRQADLCKSEAIFAYIVTSKTVRDTWRSPCLKKTKQNQPPNLCRHTHTYTDARARTHTHIKTHIHTYMEKERIRKPGVVAHNTIFLLQGRGGRRIWCSRPASATQQVKS